MAREVTRPPHGNKGRKRSHDFPDADRCTAIVQSTQLRCRNARQADSLLCGIHSGAMTAAAAKARNRAAVKRAMERVAVEAPVAPERPPTEQELEWEVARRAREAAAAKRDAELHPPEVTEAMQARGLTWIRHYLPPNQSPGGGFTWIENEDRTRHFRWVVVQIGSDKYDAPDTSGGLDEIAERARDWAAQRAKVRRMRALGVDPRRIDAFIETGSIYGRHDPRLPQAEDTKPRTLADLTLDGIKLPQIWR